VALCRLLLARSPDILLLGRATNHLDAEKVAWLEHHLQGYPGTVIAVTHDRYFLDNVAWLILELDRGEGSLEGKLLLLAGAEGEAAGRGREAGDERRKTLQRELEWIRMSPKGRTPRGQAPDQRL